MEFMNLVSFVIVLHLSKMKSLRKKPIYLGFAISELNKVILYEKYYHKLQSYFRQKNLVLHYMDCDSFVLSIRAEKFVIDLEKLEDSIDFSKLKKDRDFFTNKHKTVIGKFKIEILKNICKE